MTPDMMVIVDFEGKKLAGDRDAVVRAADAPRGLSQPARRATPSCTRIRRLPPGFAVAGIPLTRAVLAEVITTLGSIPIAEYGTPSTAELPAAVRKYIKAHDGMLLANHGARDAAAGDVMSAYYKMETIEHFAKISLVARLLGRENLISRERSRAAAGAARHVRHRGAGAALRRPDRGRRAGDAARARCSRRRNRHRAAGARHATAVLPTSASRDGEIRLTYGELTALIDGRRQELARLSGSHARLESRREHAWVRRSGWSRPRAWSP